MITLDYQTLALLLLLAFTLGLAARPAQKATRALLRAHRAARRAAQPVRKRRRTTKARS